MLLVLNNDSVCVLVMGQRVRFAKTVFTFPFCRKHNIDPRVLSIITLATMTETLIDISTLLKRLDESTEILNGKTKQKRGIGFIQCGGVELDFPLQWAANHVYVDMIKTILQLDREGLTEMGFNQVFTTAMRCNDADVATAMLHDARLDPGFGCSMALRWAALHGNVDVFKVLLADRRADPTVEYHDTLRDACRLGHTGILALLLKDNRIDPCYSNLRDMLAACVKGYVAIVDMLLANARVQAQLGEDEMIELIDVTSSTNVKAVLEAYRQRQRKTKEKEDEKSKDAVDEAQDRAKDAIVEVETKPTATTVRLEVHVYVHQD